MSLQISAKIEKESTNMILSDTHFMYKDYLKVIKDIQNINIIDKEVCKTCALFLLKKIKEEEIIDKIKTSADLINEDSFDKFNFLSINNILQDNPHIQLQEFFKSLNIIYHQMQLANTVKDDILQLIEYSSFIVMIFLRHQELYIKCFSDLYKINKFDIFFKITWLIFCICKVTILKRKYETDSSFSLLIAVYEITKEQIQGFYTIKLGNLENLPNEIGIKNLNFSVLLKEQITFQLLKIFKAENINQIFSEHSNDFESFYNTLNSNYLSILLPDEINDMLIYDHYLEQNYFNQNKRNENSSQMQSFSSINSDSTLDNSLYFNENLEISNWIAKIESFYEYDTDYLFQKFTNLHFTRKKLILFVEIYDHFKNDIIKDISTDISTDETEKDIKLLKSFYIRFLDDFLKQEKEKFGISDFTVLLGDKVFHLNMFVIIYYLFLNLINEKTNNFHLISYTGNSQEMFFKRILIFMETLNHISRIDLFLLFKITVNLRSLKLPIVLKDSIKNFYCWIISFICWQDRLNTEIFSNQLIPKDSTKILFVKHIYQYIYNIVFRLSINLNFNDEMKEKVLVIMKYILSAKIELLRNSLLDSIIISTIYAVSKLSTDKTNITFNQIIQEYCEINKSFSKQIKHLFQEIKVNGQTQDIIQNYNNMYIPNLREFLTVINTESPYTAQDEVIYPFFSFTGSFNDFILLKKEETGCKSPYLDLSTIDTRLIESSSVLGNKRFRHSSPMVSKFNQNINISNSPFIPFSSKIDKFNKPKVSKKINYEGSQN